MAATTWVAHSPIGTEWLLANGKTVKAPPIEQTGTGLKVRIAGTTESHFSRDRDDMIWTHVQKEAKRQRTSVWMPTSEHSTGRPHLVERRPKLHFIGAKNWTGTTTAWWRFQHPTLPIEAFVEVTIEGIRYAPSESAQKVTGTVRMPHTHPSHARYGRWVSARRPDIHSLFTDAMDSDDERIAFRRILPVEWPFEAAITQPTEFPAVRKGTEEFLRRIRLVEEVDEVRIPDLRDAAKPGFLVLKLVDTNVTGEFIESVRDFLDTGPAMDRAVAAFHEMQASLRELGLVLGDITSDSLLAALQGGAEALTIPVEGHPADEADTKFDTAHRLTLRLATGTFIVQCSHRAQATQKDQIAAKWEEALTIASITGQEDELLAYARGHSIKSEEVRARKILKRNS